MSPRPARASSGDVELSVVIVTWNAREDLRRCLHALPAAVAGLATEILVVDNGSTDRSLEMIAAEFPHAKGVASGKNLGFAGGINLGLHQSRGPWLAVLNPDVLPRPDSLKRLVETLAERPAAALAGPLVVDAQERVVVQDFSLPSVAGALRRLPGVARLSSLVRLLFGRGSSNRPQRVERVNGCCMLFRRSALKAVGGFPAETFLYGEEIAIGGVLRRAGYEVWYQPMASVVHIDGISVGQLWTTKEKLLVFKAARVLTTREILSPPVFAVWNLVLLTREVVYGGLRPLARVLGRQWPTVPIGDLISLHLLGVASTFRASAAERLRARYLKYCGRPRPREDAG